MSPFHQPSGGKNDIDRGFYQPGDEGPFDHTRHTKESEYHSPAYMDLQARGAQLAGQDSAQLYRTEPMTTAVQPKGSCREQGPAEPLPQVPQRIRHPLVFPEGCTITQALKIALGSDTTKTSAPTLATITTSAGADKSANEVVHKQQAMANKASSSSSCTPHSPPTLAQPSLSISHQGIPEAAAAASTSLKPMSAPASASHSSPLDEESASAQSSATFSQMPQKDMKKSRRRRPPPGARKRMAAEAAERAAAGAQLAALAVPRLKAAAAAADGAQAAAHQAAAVAADL
ncbi:hypothetical protein CVIRNUC_011161 [Coccomyxa viridis]|uniref:Uncharacterized protein n=1 Tax=Coccomyxa viridis TaxID=1274662 RepID=A0AAV1IPK6_9CHLO|nr:hypothetical protein CVIRNUC_011161 [Coccomyxa viridis]